MAPNVMKIWDNGGGAKGAPRTSSQGLQHAALWVRRVRFKETTGGVKQKQFAAATATLLESIICMRVHLKQHKNEAFVPNWGHIAREAGRGTLPGLDSRVRV
jgi:hypothetical protein